MKWLKTLICNLCLWTVLGVSFSALGQYSKRDISFRLGMYDFTDRASREFYRAVPALAFEGDVVRISPMVLRVQTGIAYKGRDYNGRRQRMGLIPLNITVVYELDLLENRFKPFIGMGVGVYYKWTNNNALGKSNDYFTYGYLLNMGMDYILYPDWILVLDFKYIHAVQTSKEEISISGILPSIGIRIPIQKGLPRNVKKEIKGL